MKRFLIHILILSLTTGALPALANWRSDVKRAEDAHTYATARQILSKRLQRKPADPDAQREMGIVLYQEGSYDSACVFMQEANRLRHKDERTLLYWGLSLERRQQYREASKVYSSLNVPALHARFIQISDKLIGDAAKRAVADETRLKDLGLSESPTDSSLAVTEFSVGALPDSLRSLGRGMSALLSSDIASVAPFPVLERTQLQPLFEELKLSKYGLTDSAKFRFIRLTGAQTVCTGRLQLDLPALSARSQLIAVPEGTAGATAEAEDTPEKFYQIEKALLAQVLKSLNIQTDAPQQRMLARCPTRSLPAFLAFCDGLEMWDSDQHDQALLMFAHAVKLDSRFTLARQELEWRRIVVDCGNDLQRYETLPGAEWSQGPTSADGDSRMATRDWLQNANPNAVRWTASASDQLPPDDAGDIPYADRYGEWIQVQIRPRQP